MTTSTEEPAVAAPDPLAKLRKAALTCLYMLIIAAALWVLGIVAARLSVVVVPFAVALLFASVLAPAVTWLHAHRVPRGLATTIVLLGWLAVFGGLIYFMVSTLIAGLPDLGDRLNDSYSQLRVWLTHGPMGLTGDQLDNVLNQGKDWLGRNRSQLATGALGVLSTATSIIAGLLVVVFLLIFALIDAVGIGIGLWVTGVPLVLPLSALVFFGAFVPIIGAFVSGLVAVLIALVSQGFVVALIVVGVVLLVQQLEGNVLEPLLMSRSVELHPVAVLLSITVGVELAGIVGALFAVPVLATVRAVYRSMT